MERRIRAETELAIPTAATSAVVAADPGIALPGRLQLVAGGLSRAVAVTIDEPMIVDGGVVVPVAWHAAGFPQAFPRFFGDLVVSASDGGTRLALEGVYSVPLGAVGRFGDGLVGRRLARESLEDLLGGVAHRIEQAIGDARCGEASVTLTEPAEIVVGR